MARQFFCLLCSSSAAPNNIRSLGIEVTPPQESTFSYMARRWTQVRMIFLLPVFIMPILQPLTTKYSHIRHIGREVTPRGALHDIDVQAHGASSLMVAPQTVHISIFVSFVPSNTILIV
jgi:hypothetical protein